MQLDSSEPRLTAPSESFYGTFEKVLGSPPPAVDGPLKERWNQTVGELTELPSLNLDEGQKERHRIYCLLLMSLVDFYWNPLKRGRQGKYPLNDQPGPQGGPFEEGDYQGHNIAAIAVDAHGRIIDFEFNHNVLFDSSAEHAESRLVRRVYSLARLSDSWSPLSLLGTPATSSKYVNLSDVTIYTSLESCTQCAGTMALAQIREVVYLQTDPGMFWIGRILRNLTVEALRAPRPIAGAEIDFPYFSALDETYGSFARSLSQVKPFFISCDGKVDATPSMTSFLCTSRARDIYRQASSEFQGNAQSVRLAYPNSKSSGGGDDTLTNADVMTEALDFFRYATTRGRRGTPHR
jgi:tRNA(Arg) A34 adenosine deaminase TadA